MKTTPIEHLEYAKDSINKAKRNAKLPKKYEEMLSLICSLLSNLQEYLFYK